jgi:ribosomal protein S12 methylthiotransferase
LDQIRNKINNVGIRTSFIVGFPGETEKEFQELYDFVAEQKLDRVGVFRYSQEDNTPAYVYGDRVLSVEEKNIRYGEIMQLQQKISLEKNKQMVGKKYTVLIDGKEEDGSYFARTEYDSVDIDNRVVFKSPIELEIGSFIDVKIVEALEYDLVGEIITI